MVVVINMMMFVVMFMMMSMMNMAMARGTPTKLPRNEVLKSSHFLKCSQKFSNLLLISRFSGSADQ